MAKKDDIGFWVFLGGLSAAAIAIAAASASSAPQPRQAPQRFPCPRCRNAVDAFSPVCPSCGAELTWPTG